MSRIAIVTDSNSGISQKKAEEMGIHVLPMPFLIDGKEYLDGIDLFPKEFYEYLAKDADVSFAALAGIRHGALGPPSEGV